MTYLTVWRNYSRLLHLPRRWRLKKFKASRIYLEAHEREVILRDMAELGGEASASDLRLRFPDRYHERYLPAALKRLQKEGAIRWTARSFRGSLIYKLKSDD